MMTRRASVIAWISGTLLAIVLYVFSSGPSCWVLTHASGDLAEQACQAFNTIYVPLGWASRYSPRVGRTMSWYYEFWGLRPLPMLGEPLPPEASSAWK
jgi:hypothetical protein